MSEIKIGVDWAQGDDKTCVVFIRKEVDGVVTVIGELFGESAEYVALLEEEMEALKNRKPSYGKVVQSLTILECENDELKRANGLLRTRFQYYGRVLMQEASRKDVQPAEKQDDE